METQRWARDVDTFDSVGIDVDAVDDIDEEEVA